MRKMFFRFLLVLLIVDWHFFSLISSLQRIPEARAEIVSNTEGMVLYGETGKNTPSYKIWNGSAFGSELNAGTATSEVNWVHAAGAPSVRQEKLVGIVAGASNTLYLQRWNSTTWSNEWNTNLNNTNKRSFAIAYEQSSGNALVVYGDSTSTLKYRKWNGTSWTSEADAGTALDGNPQFVSATGRSFYATTRQNDIFVAVTTVAGSLYSLRWDGSAWGNQVQMTTNPAQTTQDVFGVTFEQSRGDAMVVWGTSAGEIRTRKFTSSWQSEVIAYSGLTNNAKWLDVAPDRLASSNNIAIIWNDAGDKIQFGVWNGTSWETRPTAIDTDAIDRRNVSVAWEKHTGKALFAFIKNATNEKVLSWRTWTSAGGFSTVTQEAGATTSRILWVKLRTDTKSNNIQGVFLDSTAQLYTRRWNGSSFDSGFTSQDTNISSTTNEPFDFSWDDSASTLTQNYHRWYVDNDSVIPSDPWPSGSADVGENTAITASDIPPASSEKLRLRISLGVSVNKFVAGEEQLKLQFGERVTTCSAITSGWTDTGAISSGAIWRGYNATPEEGASLSTDPPTAGDLKLSVSDRAGSYEEANPSALNPFPVFASEDVEYDWLVQDNGAATETTYCFRMVLNSGQELGTYTYYPQLITSGYRAVSQNWRFYDDETNETPLTALAAENTAPTNVSVTTQNTLKLRMTLAENANVAGTDMKFKLQTSESSTFASGVSSLLEIGGSCTGVGAWCYADGTDADDSAIVTRVLTDSTSNGRHNESGTSASTLDPAASSVMEFEFTIRLASNLRTGSTYYFRAYNVTKGVPVPLASSETYPRLTTEDPTLSVTVGALSSGTSTEGITTDVTTTATTIPFGTLVPNVQTEGAQRITISTNAAYGYKIFLRSPTPSFTTGVYTINPISGTNASPSAWSYGVNVQSSMLGAFGYHTGDDVLSDGATTRFTVNNTWAQVASTEFGDEIAYSIGPVTNETLDLVYKVEISGILNSGTYSLNDVQFLVVPLY